MPVVPPHLLNAIADNGSNSQDDRDAAQRTLNTDHARGASGVRMSPAPPPRPSDPLCRKLVEFYDPSIKGTDGRERTLDQILQWRDSRLEQQHDYIQTLFPLPESSMFAMAPVIDEETFHYFRQSKSLQDNLRRAFERMLAFYGFNVKWQQEQPGICTVSMETEMASKPNLKRWVCPMDHNHLRITRILRSLRVLGLEEEARAYFNALRDVYDKTGRIGSTSMRFWTRAAELPLHTAPDGTEIDWLEKYETDDSTSQDVGADPKADADSPVAHGDDRRNEGHVDDAEGTNDRSTSPKLSKKSNKKWAKAFADMA
ncbi:opioid growth factor receptor conserved region-domain-containing protein [Xylariaceae sp. FL0016]|nr:opioid growth factor receptor conserved region-domain-containing protein [Xylariaceae sp. FL0016]